MMSEMSSETKSMIVEMFKVGKKPSMIATELGINNSIIYSFLKRFKQTGSIENKKRKGRTPKWTTRDNNRLSILVKTNRKATVRTLWRLFNENKVNTVRLDTIRVKLKGLGMIRRSLKKSEFSCRNRIKRIRFAKTYMKWTADDWKKVIFSDESQFVIEDPKRIKLWRKSGEKYNYHQHYTTSSTQKSLHVMVWGVLQEMVLAL